MPTATTFANYQFANLGPLTTTYTAPASCITGTDHVRVVQSDVPMGAAYMTDCGLQANTVGACRPSGAQMDSDNSIAYATGQAPHIYYYSPGIACPASWTTVAVAAKATDGHMGNWNLSGVVSSTTATTTAQRGRFHYLDGDELYEQILDPGETVVGCCPSGYTAYTSNLLCYSELPTSVYQPSAGTLCQAIYTNTGIFNVTLTSNGVTETRNVFGVTGTAPPTIRSTTIPAKATTEYAGANRVGMLMLVHKEADVAAASSSNPASSLRPPMGGNFGAWPVAVVAAGLAAGAALMLPLAF